MCESTCRASRCSGRSCGVIYIYIYLYMYVYIKKERTLYIDHLLKYVREHMPRIALLWP